MFVYSSKRPLEQEGNIGSSTAVDEKERLGGSSQEGEVRKRSTRK